jgi:hypothetical protein
MEAIKRKSKVIILKGEDDFIRLLASQFGTTADMEINLIKVLIKFDLFNPFNLDKYIRRRIQKEMNVPYTTLGTAITRLIKSGIIARNGKNVYVNVAFRNLEDIDSIVFKKPL